MENQFLNTLKRIVVLLLVSVVLSTALFAGGDKYSPRLVGMGRTFSAVSRGLDAVGVNPANLALNDRDATVTVNIVPLGVSLGSDFLNLKIYNDFFTGIPDPNDPNNRLTKNLSDQDKQDILALFPEGIARTQVGVQMAPVGVSIQIGDFGFAVVPSVHAAANIDLSEGYLKFPLNGIPQDAFYSFNNTAVNASVVGEVNFSAGYMLPLEFPNVREITAGIGIKYLSGLGYIATDHYNATLQQITYQSDRGDGQLIIDSMGLKGDFDFLQFVAKLDPDDPKPIGSGLGFDIGVSALLFDAVYVGASVTDIGSMKWDKQTKAIIGKASFDIDNIAEKESQDTVKNAFKGTTIDTTGFEFDLPTAFHLGAAVQLDDLIDAIPFRWLVAVDMHLGFNEVAGNTKLPQFAIGTELDPLAGWLPLRTGILLGGRDRFAWSAGFGIHLANTFDLDFATQSIAIITNPEGFRTGSFTMGMRLRF